jgi:hypothetical protein
MPPLGFETTISAGERPKTYALDRAATGNGSLHISSINYFYLRNLFRLFVRDREAQISRVKDIERKMLSLKIH